MSNVPYVPCTSRACGVCARGATQRVQRAASAAPRPPPRARGPPGALSKTSKIGGSGLQDSRHSPVILQSPPRGRGPDRSTATNSNTGTAPDAHRHRPRNGGYVGRHVPRAHPPVAHAAPAYPLGPPPPRAHSHATHHTDPTQHTIENTQKHLEVDGHVLEVRWSCPPPHPIHARYTRHIANTHHARTHASPT